MIKTRQTTRRRPRLFRYLRAPTRILIRRPGIRGPPGDPWRETRTSWQ